MNNSDLIYRVAHCMTQFKKASFTENSPVSNVDIEKWNWPQGVGMYGLYRYWESTKNQEILDWLFGWYERRFKEGLPDKNINSVTPLLTLCYLQEIKPNPVYLSVIKEWADYIVKEFPRTDGNGFEHSGIGINDLYGQLWDDTLFMTCLFLARAGKLLNKKEYIAECERQFLVHCQYLFDKETGLWFHGWTFKGKNNFGKALWGRGNCWITVAIPDLLEMDVVGEGVKLFLTDVLEQQAKALVRFQNENGMWHTVINETDSYVESSATSGFGYGILKAIRLGFLSEEYYSIVEKAVNAIRERIDDNGAVKQVSYGTNVGDNTDCYKSIPYCETPYGQALALLMLNEAEKLNV